MKKKSIGLDDKIRVDQDTTFGKLTPHTPDTPFQILTAAEVAQRLRVHRSTVSRLAMSGELKSYLIGNRRLFKSCDVGEFFENQSSPEYVSRKET